MSAKIYCTHIRRWCVVEINFLTKRVVFDAVARQICVYARRPAIKMILLYVKLHFKIAHQNCKCRYFFIVMST